MDPKKTGDATTWMFVSTKVLVEYLSKLQRNKGFRRELGDDCCLYFCVWRRDRESLVEAFNNSEMNIIGVACRNQFHSREATQF